MDTSFKELVTRRITLFEKDYERKQAMGTKTDAHSDVTKLHKELYDLLQNTSDTRYEDLNFLLHAIADLAQRLQEKEKLREASGK